MHAVIGKRTSKTYPLSPLAVLGRGAEGCVYFVNGVVVKVFTSPLSLRRAEKTELLIKLSGKLPGFACPKELVLNPQTKQPVGEVQDPVDGDTLEDLLDEWKGKRAPALSERERVRVAIRVAKAVTAAHAVKVATVVLRDVIKAGNLLLDGTKATFIDTSSACVLGFRSDKTGLKVDAVERLVTPGYMPKEVLRNRKVRPAQTDDLFSLAVLLFEILFGFQPTDCPRAIGMDPDYAVREGIFPRYLSDPDFPPPTYYAAFTPDEIEGLFRAAFLGSPVDRPTAKRWVEALTRWERTLSRYRALLKRVGRGLLALVRVKVPKLPDTVRIFFAALVLVGTLWAWSCSVSRQGYPPDSPVQQQPPAKSDPPGPPPAPVRSQPPAKESTSPEPPGPSAGPAFYREFFK